MPGNSVINAVREKYPQYADVEDDELTRAIGQKYPQYLDVEDFAKDFKRVSGALTQPSSETTSAGGAMLRTAVKGAVPAAAFGTGFGAVYPWATGALAPVTGPLAPILGAIPAAIAGSVAARAAGAVQGAVAETVAPETTKRFEELERADVEQHPGAVFAGELASGLPSMRLAPGTVARGIGLLPRLARGAATAAEKQAVGEAAGRVVGGAVFGAATPLLEGRLPTWHDVLSGAAFTSIYGEPRWHAPGARAGARYAQRGKLGYLSRQAIKEGVAEPIEGGERTEPEPPETEEGGAGVTQPPPGPGPKTPPPVQVPEPETVEARTATTEQLNRARKLGYRILANRGVAPDVANLFVERYVQQNQPAEVGEKFRSDLNAAFDESGLLSEREANQYSNEARLRAAEGVGSESEIQQAIEKHAQRAQEIAANNRKILANEGLIEKGKTSEGEKQKAGALPVVERQPAQAQPEAEAQAGTAQRPGAGEEKQAQPVLKPEWATDYQPEQWRVTVQRDAATPEGGTIPTGYVQMDRVIDGQNTHSTNPEAMRQAGLEVPTTAELKTLPQGQYTLAEAVKKLGEKAAPVKPTTINQTAPGAENLNQPAGGQQKVEPITERVTPPLTQPAKETTAVPAKAPVAKAQAEVSKVAKTEGVRSAKEIKTELISKIEAAHKNAPLLADWRKGMPSHITIEIPGDGTFKVLNSKEAIGEVLANAKRIATNPNVKRTVKSSQAVGDIAVQAESAAKAYGSPEEAYRSAIRQRDALQSQEPPAEAAEREAWNKQIESADFLAMELYGSTKAGKLETQAEAARDRVATYKIGAQGFEKEIARLEAIKKKNPANKERLKDLKERYAENRAFIETNERNAAKWEQEAAKEKAALEQPAAKPSEAVPEKGLDEQIEAQKAKLKDSASGFYKMGITPQMNLQFYRDLYDLAVLYVKKGVKTVEDFARETGFKVSATLRKAWEDASAGRAPEAEAEKVPTPEASEFRADTDGAVTRVMGSEDNVLGRPKASPAADAAALGHLHQAIDQSGLRVVTTPNRSLGGVEFVPDGFNYDAEGQRLIAHLEAELALAGGADRSPYHLAALINSIRLNHERGNLNDIFSEPVRDRLYQLTQSEASHYGLMLHSLQRFGQGIERIARDVRVYLKREWRKEFGGQNFDAIFRRVMERLTRDLPDAAATTLRDHPDVQEFVERVIEANARDLGGRVYRRFQQLMKPKSAKRLGTLLADTRAREAVQKLVEDAKRQGMTPRKVPGKTKLEPWEELLYLANPENASRVQDLIEDAVRQGERNAARAMAERRLSPEELDLYDQRTRDPRVVGPDPVPEEIAGGLETPEFKHWQVVRDHFLGYDPTTLRLARQVLSKDFRGTRFDPARTRPADTRIDLAKLARSPEAEVQRVLDGYLADVEASVDLSGATPETTQRIRQMMAEQLAEQLAARRKEFLDNFFDPKAIPRVSASDRLKRILNAGVERDERFRSERVRRLVQSLASIPAEEFEAQAVRPRAEKNGWVQDKLIEVSNREGWDALDPATRDYFEAVTFTKLAEGLANAEERITRRFLGGKDVSHAPKPARTEAEKLADIERRRDEAAGRLRGLIQAGGFDTALVNEIARKSAVNKLLPTMKDLIGQVLETPIYRQSDLRTRFVERLVNNMGIDPAQAEKAWAVFDKAFASKFAEARSRAARSALAAMTPAEKKSVPRPMYEKLERLVNAGVLDSGEMLRALARERGWVEPTDAEIERMRALAEREQQLREIPPTERVEMEAANASPEDFAKRQGEVMAETQLARDSIIRELTRLWSKFSNPIQLPKFSGIDTWKGAWTQRRNLYRALHEYVTLSLITKIGFPIRIFEHLTTQLVGHALIRPLARVQQLWKIDRAQGNAHAVLPDLVDAYADTFKAWAAAMRPAVAAMRAELRGRGEARNVDRLMTGIQGLERTAAYAREHMGMARELMKAGDLAKASVEYAKGFTAHLFAFPRLMGWVISAADQWQGVPAEYQDLLHRIELSARENGVSRAESAAWREGVFKDLKARWIEAMSDTRRDWDAHGIEGNENQLSESAWKLVLHRAYEDARRIGAPVDEIRGDNEALRRSLAWQEEVRRGPGAVMSGIVKKMPLTWGAFANAIGHSINYAFMWLPPPLHKLAEWHPRGEKEPPSGWFRTDLDRSQRLMQSLVGTAIGGYLTYLIFNGNLRVIPHFIASKEERDRLEKQGHKPGTVEITLPDGRFIPFSMTVGPFQPMAPYLAGAGAAFDLAQKRIAQQKKLNEDAAKAGLPAGQLPPPELSDYMLIAGAAAWQTIMGSKTAGGWSQQFLEPGRLEANFKRMAAGFVQPFIPGAPAWGEVARMEGVALDKRLATVWDYLVPLPTSQARALNVLGDPVGTPNAVQRVLQVITGGTYPAVVDPATQGDDHAAYAALFASEWRPPLIDPKKGYNVNGVFRPLTDNELEKYTEQRGKLLKGALTGLGASATAETVKAAYQEAQAGALASVGAAGKATTGATGASRRTGQRKAPSRRLPRLSRLSTRMGRGVRRLSYGRLSGAGGRLINPRGRLGRSQRALG